MRKPGNLYAKPGNALIRHSILALTIYIVSCSPLKEQAMVHQAIAPVIIYKMKADYSHLVPLLLNSEKTKIVSFPAPGDLFISNELALPLKLNSDYWLDNKGIGPNTVFSNFTYEEYSQFESPPSVQILMSGITDMNPFLEMYQCDHRRDDSNFVRSLKTSIKKGMEGCKNLLK